jgi:hypothetical protein
VEVLVVAAWELILVGRQFFFLFFACFPFFALFFFLFCFFCYDGAAGSSWY